MDPQDMPSVDTPDEEMARERDWWAIETEVIGFAQRYGWPAVLRAVARAMSEQPDLPLANQGNG